MTIYRVHFTWQEKKYALKATSLDMTHPYFVAIKDLVLPQEKSYLINPADDEIRKNFAGVRQLMLPFQSISLIEEYPQDPDQLCRDSASGSQGKVISNRIFKKT